jgi:hypothetical protein
LGNVSLGRYNVPKWKEETATRAYFDELAHKYAENVEINMFGPQLEQLQVPTPEELPQVTDAKETPQVTTTKETQLDHSHRC